METLHHHQIQMKLKLALALNPFAIHDVYYSLKANEEKEFALTVNQKEDTTEKCRNETSFVLMPRKHILKPQKGTQYKCNKNITYHIVIYVSLLLSSHARLILRKPREL